MHLGFQYISVVVCLKIWVTYHSIALVSRACGLGGFVHPLSGTPAVRVNESRVCYCVPLVWCQVFFFFFGGVLFINS